MLLIIIIIFSYITAQVESVKQQEQVIECTSKLKILQI